MKLFLDESGKKSQNVPSISDLKLKSISSQKKLLSTRFFANCRESPERGFRKKTQIFTIFAIVKYRNYCVIIVSFP